ncbi:MAG TPA: transglycosylase SLT domain-containing protein [Rhodopila sp.]
MSRCVSPDHPVQSRPLRWAYLITCLALLSVLAACGSQPARHARTQYKPSRYYPPPGTASDPWGPYIHEASGRFGVPEIWIRRVMRQESGGQEDVISWAGAMGLMQVMPDTYDGLRGRYNLGDDPFDPHNNILAGTAYLREMYDRFGAPGFLAAYNAGPNRLDSYLNDGRPLPDETVNYVASIAPLLGPGTPMSGPLAVYAGPVTRYAARSTPAGCDPDAAYNPNGPCTPLRPAAAPPVAMASNAAAPVYEAPYQQGDCDPDAAYDPTRPCRPAPPLQTAAVSQPAAYAAPAQVNAAPLPPRAYADASTAYAAPSPASAGPSAGASPAYRDAAPGRDAAYGQEVCDPDAAYDPSRPCQPPPATMTPVVAQPLPPPAPARMGVPPRDAYAAAPRPVQERMTQTVAFTPGPSAGRWAIQVGAFASLATAQTAAENARSVVPDVLRTAKIELPATTPFGSQVAFRARLSGLSPSAAANACARLSGRGMACMTVPPPRGPF